MNPAALPMGGAAHVANRLPMKPRKAPADKIKTSFASILRPKY
jgi:hypothetical protein